MAECQKTIAVATITKAALLSNVGSFFQHYALRRTLKSFGYRPFRVSAKLTPLGMRNVIVAAVIDCLRPVHWVLRRDSDVVIKSRALFSWNCRRLKFVYWYRKLIGPVVEEQNYDDLTIGIMGGDQIFGSMEPVKWLSLIKDGNRCVSYAASADWKVLSCDDAWKSFARQQVGHFAAIGLREQKGVDMCKTLWGNKIEVKHVADPVLLLGRSEYEKVMLNRPVFRRPTLFCYLVNVHSADELQLCKYEHVAERLGCELRIMGIQGAEKYLPLKYAITLSPPAFLRAVNDAKYFITNSYHGSVFAMLYEKSFLSVRQINLPGTNQNDRQEELMTDFGLLDRWVAASMSEDAIVSLLRAKVEWNPIHLAMSHFAHQSLQWLKNQLQERNENT